MTDMKPVCDAYADWAAAYDTTIGLRVHLDAAHQRL